MKSNRAAHALTVNRGVVSQGSSLSAEVAACSWQRHLIGWLPIASLYMVLGFYQIGDQSLWTDEVISIGRTLQTAPALMASQSPLYFFLLSFWTGTTGETEFALRSLSAVLGLAAVGLVYVTGLKLFNRRIALVASLLMATSPYFIWYAQEVRYVTLLVTTSLAMTYSFRRALSSGGWRWWALYGMASALALFTFPTVAFLVVAHGLFLICRTSDRPLLKKWVASQIIIAILFAAWFIDRTAHKLPTILSNRPALVSSEHGRSRQKLPITDVVGTIPYTFFAFSVGFSLGPSLKELHESRSVGSLLSHAPVIIPATVVFVSLFVLGWWRLRRSEYGNPFLLLWMGVPIVGAFAAATLTTYHVYNTRYVAMALPAYVLVLAAGITAIRRRTIQIGLMSAVLCVNGVSLSNYYFDSRYARADARSAGKYLESAAQTRDIILVAGSPTALRYYYNGSLPIELVQPQRATKDLLVRYLRELAESYQRLWLVEIRPWESDPKREVKTMLDQLGLRGSHRKFAGVDIYSYVLPD